MPQTVPTAAPVGGDARWASTLAEPHDARPPPPPPPPPLIFITRRAPPSIFCPLLQALPSSTRAPSPARSRPLLLYDFQLCECVTAGKRACPRPHHAPAGPPTSASCATMRLKVRLMRSPTLLPRRRGTECCHSSCTLPAIARTSPLPRENLSTSLLSALRRSKKSRRAPSDTEAAGRRGGGGVGDRHAPPSRPRGPLTNSR